MNLSIRLLADADLESADAILKSAFRYTESRIMELRMYRRVQPDGWFLALSDGRPVGMVGATNYADFAYVGSMAVHQDFQRQGVGLALMRHLLAWLDKQMAPLVLLDASEKGQPLYEKLGFLTSDYTHVFQHSGVGPSYPFPRHVQVMTFQDLNALVKYDRDVFGADRVRVLHDLLDTFPGRAFMVRDQQGRVTGYLFAQGNRIGPWVAQRPQDAEGLLQAALSLSYEGAISVVIPDLNQDGMVLLARYGFNRLRTNRHMGRGQGTSPTMARRKVYGQTSLALG